MATERQKAAFREYLRRRITGEPLIMSEIMRKVGYSKSSAQKPKYALTQKKGWQELLKSIDDEPLLNRLVNIALDKKDKRASIDAIRELFKLKDRYPKEKLKIGLFLEELSQIIEINQK